jgi:hypothetical protein
MMPLDWARNCTLYTKQFLHVASRAHRQKAKVHVHVVFEGRKISSRSTAGDLLLAGDTFISIMP